MKTNDKSNRPFQSESTETLFARRQEILKAIPELDLAHVIRASLATRFVKCGKPNCRCATGEGHKSFYLSSFYHGKTRIDFVPKSCYERISQCTREYDELMALLAELSCINLELFRRREIDL